MDADFPAAHSMDASWYAIDKNGHVALFITGAGGAMPNGAYSPEGAEMMAEYAEEEVLAGAARQHVGAETADQDVAAGAAGQHTAVSTGSGKRTPAMSATSSVSPTG